MIEAMWTTTNLPTSILIRWGLKEDVSHFAIAFDRKEVWHSNFTGLHLVSYKEFMRKNKVVYKLEFDLAPQDEEEQWQNLDADAEVWYDWGAFFYFIWRAILWRFFDKPFPKTNKWGSREHLLCTGTGDMLIPCLKPSGIDDFEMISPKALYLKMKEVYLKNFIPKASTD